MNKENIKIIDNDYSYVFEEIERLLKKKERLTIAIDGRCGSGKSTLAASFEERFNCNVFHMDDFYLPFDMRTTEILEKPGGNIYYERLKTEVMEVLKKSHDVMYRKYLCSQGIFGETKQMKFKNISIIEGSYSMHPVLQNNYDYKIFLTVDSKVQYERIRKRNGEEKLKEFLNKWIPKEEYYFGELDIKNKCDIIVDTTMIPLV